jgi:hypothetical protein
MNSETKDFTLFVKKIFNDFFVKKLVLDVGIQNSNGNNRFLFNNDCEYHVNNEIYSNNVTIITKTQDLPFRDNTFDTIIYTEKFEDNLEYKLSFIKNYSMLKPNGLFCFTCASNNKKNIETIDTPSLSSYNLTEIDLNDVLPLYNSFTVWDTYYNNISKDFYFVGIKKGDTIFPPLVKYIKKGVENTSINIY